VTRATVAIAASMLLLAACERAEQPAHPPADPATPSPASPMHPADPDVAPPAGAIQLRSMGGSGVTGHASMGGPGGDAITLSVTGASPDARIQAAILSGTCDNLGGGVADLDIFFPDARGSATREIRASIPAAGPEGQALVLYQVEGEGGRMIACGEVR
jgi:hypothetical protein